MQNERNKKCRDSRNRKMKRAGDKHETTRNVSVNKRKSKVWNTANQQLEAPMSEACKTDLWSSIIQAKNKHKWH